MAPQASVSLPSSALVPKPEEQKRIPKPAAKPNTEAELNEVLGKLSAEELKQFADNGDLAKNLYKGSMIRFTL